MNVERILTLIHWGLCGVAAVYFARYMLTPEPDFAAAAIGLYAFGASVAVLFIREMTAQ